jgi:hypothetical protein
VSLPDPIVIAVLGSISSVLPSDDVSLVVLHLDVSGVIDAAAGTLAIDASLHDSDIVGFALAGDMALRAAFSGEPSLLMALGGFHPGFEPPADFPQLARLSLGLSAPPVIDVQLECYLAVTSNTVQFGARVELRASVAGFGIDGDTEFDALVQFSPFLVSTQLGFHVTVTAASVGLAGVWLDASVEGPNPWHIVGTACFRLLGLDEEVRIDERIGAPVPEAAAAGADPLSLIRTALAAPEAWSAPVTTSPGVVLAAASADAPAAAAELAAMPDGLVAVSQGAVPLGVTLDKVGDAPPGDYDLFEVEPAGASVSSSGQLQDWFAPGTFFELERSELLASPSFELLKSGIEFGGGEPTAGPDLACSLDFEQILRDPGNGEDRVELGDEPPPSGAQALVATGRLPAGGFATAPAGQPVTMAADGWAVTDRDSGAVLARTASWSRAHQSDQGRRAATTIVPAWEAPE